MYNRSRTCTQQTQSALTTLTVFLVMSSTTESEQPLAMSTSAQALEMDRLWRIAFTEDNASAMEDFNALYARCNDDARSCIDGFRSGDVINKKEKYCWRLVSSGVSAVTAFKQAEIRAREGHPFYYGGLRPAT